MHSNFVSPHLEYGRINEDKARAASEAKENIFIQPCGLYVDKEYPFVGATQIGWNCWRSWNSKNKTPVIGSRDDCGRGNYERRSDLLGEE